MNQRNLYLLNSVISLLFALGLLLVTQTMLQLFGLNVSDGSKLLAQFLGAELVIGGLVTLMARDVMDLRAISAINFANMVGDALGFILALNATFIGTMGPMGYVAVIVYAVLGLGFAYFQFFKPAM